VKKFIKFIISFNTPTALFFVSVCAFCCVVGPLTTFAAIDPGLGAVASFSILSQTTITGRSTISGNVGNNATGAGITALTTPDVAGTIYSSDGVATLGSPSANTIVINPAVQSNASTVYTTNIPSQGTNGTIIGNLGGQTFTPGVYDQGSMLLAGGVVHLNGPGIYIFRSASDLTSSGSISLENGARACDVYWRVQTLASINGASFVGTILSGTGVHFGPGVTLNGRALGVGPTADVTLGVGGTISGPTCPPSPPTLHVIKQVVNTSGGTATSSDFILHVKSATSSLDVSGSPALGATTPGTLYSLSAGSYLISEDASTTYTQSFSGDCDVNGNVTLSLGDMKTCIITNHDIVPPVPVVPPPSGGGGIISGPLSVGYQTPAPTVFLPIQGQVPGPSTVATTSGVAVPLTSLPYTGHTLGDELWSDLINLVIPSAVFALLGSLYLFRKKI